MQTNRCEIGYSWVDSAHMCATHKQNADYCDPEPWPEDEEDE